MKSWILIIFSFLLFSSFSHPFYVSVAEINYKSEEGNIEIAIKLFTDDLENALEEAHAPKLWLGEENELEDADNYIADYLQEHLKLYVNKEWLKGSYLGKEVDVHVTWCYIEISNVEAIEKLSIENNIFTELFDGQTNVVHTKVKKQEKSFIFNRNKTLQDIEIE